MRKVRSFLKSELGKVLMGLVCICVGFVVPYQVPFWAGIFTRNEHVEVIPVWLIGLVLTAFLVLFIYACYELGSMISDWL